MAAVQERPEALDDPLSRWVPPLVAVAIVAACARAFYFADATYLHPDEAQQFIRGARATFVQALRAAFTQSHPPGYPLLLFGLWHVSASQVFLRGASIIAAGSGAWFFFRWLQRAFNSRVAIVGALLLVGSPVFLIIAMQMRQYGFLLLFVGATLYSMERMVRERSPAWAAVYSLCNTGVLLTFYGGAWVVIALGICVPLRLWWEGAPRSVWLAWAIGQGLEATLALLLFRYHVLALRESVAWASNGFLAGSFRVQQASAATFLLNSTDRVFEYFAFGLPTGRVPWLGRILALAYAAGVVRVGLDRRRWPLAPLLLLPLIGAAVGGTMRWLPYGATRHVSYLFPFLMAGAALAIDWLLPRLSVLLPVFALTLPWRIAVASPPMSPLKMPRTAASEVAEWFEHTVPSGTTVFTDRQSFYLLRFYLAAGVPVAPTLRDNLMVMELAGWRLVTTRGLDLWTFDAKNLRESIRRLGTPLDVGFDAPVWVVSHSVEPRRPLAQELRDLSAYRRIGRFEVFQVRVQ